MTIGNKTCDMKNPINHLGDFSIDPREYDEYSHNRKKPKETLQYDLSEMFKGTPHSVPLDSF
ncbi:MAG: hypothetical protein FAF03_11465 [Epsilonproteobacteria bacterium]|nr:hypothetical protein [Campylobacterota bacterium]